MTKKLLSLALAGVMAAPVAMQAENWVRVADSSDLVAGGKYLMVFERPSSDEEVPDVYWCMGGQNGVNRNALEMAAPEEGRLTEVPEGATVLTINSFGGGFSLYADGEGFLAPTSDGKKTLEVVDDAVAADITVNNGKASVVYTNQNEKNVLTIFQQMSWTGPSYWVFTCADQKFDNGFLAIYRDMDAEVEPIDPPVAETKWVRVADNNELEAGAKYMVVFEMPENEYYDAEYFYMSSVQNAKNRNALAMDEPVDGVIKSVPEDAAIIDINQVEGGYTLYSTNGDAIGYLAPTSDGSRTFKTVEEPMTATINIKAGKASVIYQGFNAKNILSIFKETNASWQQFWAFTCVDQAYDRGFLAFYKEMAGGGGETPVIPVADVKWTADPADGSKVESFQNWTLNFEGVADIDAKNSTADMMTVTYNGTGKDWFVGTIRGGSVTFSLRPYTCEGEGTVVIEAKEGLLNLTLEDGSVVKSPAFTYTVNVGKVTTPEYTLITDPEDGSTVEIVENMMFFFDGCEMEANEDATTDMVSAYLNGNEIQAPAAHTRYINMFVYRNPVTEPGVYELQIAEGYWNLVFEDGTVIPSPEILYTLYVAGQSSEPEQVYTVYPEPGKYEYFPKTEMTYTEFDYVDLIGEEATLFVGDDAYVLDLSVKNENTLVLTPRENITSTPDVEVYVYIPAQTYVLGWGDGQAVYNEETYIFNYILDKNVAVEVVAAEETVNVYTATGICVARDEMASVLRTLPAGLYIVNGRKVVVR